MVENIRTESPDPVLNSYLKKFSNQLDLESQMLDAKPEEIYSKKFEVFTAALALHDACPSAWKKVQDPMSLTVGGSDDKGLDSVIIVVNNLYPVADLDELESLHADLQAQDRSIESVDFIFSQSKTSQYFKRDNVLSAISGVRHFMGPKLKTKNKDLEIKHQIKNAIYDYWEEIKNVRAYLYYMTQSPKPLDSVVLGDAMVDIDDMNGDQGVFHNFTKKGGYLKFIPCNASKITSMYESYSRYEREVTFEVDESIVLPEIEGIKKSFMTYIYFKEFLNIILEGDNKKYIDESIFEENVRSFQGENEVNSKILNTLKGGGADKFFVLNNGITMIADGITTNPKHKKFTVRNYQIINGCQTSNMLYRYYLYLLESDTCTPEKLDEVYIPLKIIEVKNDGLTSEIVESTNSQTSIGSDQLHALGSVTRKIQKFFNVLKDEGTGKQYMYYERRNNEYAGKLNIKKLYIINQDAMLGIFAATYLKLPHKTSRYAGRLKKEEYLKKVFNEKHPAIKYFSAAYAYVRYETERTRGTQFQASLRWHTLMVYNVLFGEDYSDDSDAEKKVGVIKKNLSRENLLIANNVVLKFIEDNSSYSNQSIRSLNKKEEFTKALVSYAYGIKNSDRENKFNDFIEFVYRKDELVGRQVLETEKIPEHSLPGSTIYGVPELLSVLEDKISKEASHLFNRIFNGTIEWGNLTFRWRNSDQKNSTYKFYIYVSSKSGSTPIRVGQVVYGKRDKDFKINLGLQYKQLEENPDFYDEFISRKVDGFTCDFSDEKNNIEYGYIVFGEKSSDDLLMLVNDILSKTCIVKNNTI